MRSKVADEVRREQREAEMKLSPGERILRALAIGERSLESFMATSGLTREEAIERIERLKREGRRCARAKRESS